jgi:hypothetical protein
VLIEELARGHSKTHAAYASTDVSLGLGLPALSPGQVIKHWHATAAAVAADVQQERDMAYRARLAELVAMGEAAPCPEQRIAAAPDPAALAVRLHD